MKKPNNYFLHRNKRKQQASNESDWIIIYFFPFYIKTQAAAMMNQIGYEVTQL